MLLTEREAAGMTVNERLYGAGLLEAFDRAVSTRDVSRLREILTSVYLAEPEIFAVVAQVRDPEWAVVVETARRFSSDGWQRATSVLKDLELPLLCGSDRFVDRAPVKLAILILSDGSVATLEAVARRATMDWRDVLASAGLENEDWREVLSEKGVAVAAERDK